MAVSSARPKGIRLRTSFVSEAEFVAAFHELADEGSIFVPTDKLYTASTNCYFSIELADETPLLRGLGTVIESWSSPLNPFEQPGIHVHITQLTAQSEPVFERLLAARPAELHKSGPRTRKAPMTQQQWGSVIAPPTTQMDSVPSDDADLPPRNSDAESTVNARPITRELRSPSIPPLNKAVRTKAPSAAPVAELDEKTTETQRYEAHMRLPALGTASGNTAPARAAPAVSPPPPLANSGFTTSSTTLAAPPPNVPAEEAPTAVSAQRSVVEATAASVDAATVEDDGLYALPSAWWKLAWWRDGSWRKSWWATRWRNAQWRNGGWRNQWWANRRTGGVLAAGIVVGVLFTVLLRPSHSTNVAAVAANVPAQHPAPVCAPAPAATQNNVEVATATVLPAKGAKAAPKAAAAPVKVASASPAAKSAPPASTPKSAAPAPAKSVVAAPAPKSTTPAMKSGTAAPPPTKSAPAVASTTPSKSATTPPTKSAAAASPPTKSAAAAPPKSAPAIASTAAKSTSPIASSAKPTTPTAKPAAPPAKPTTAAAAKPTPGTGATSIAATGPTTKSSNSKAAKQPLIRPDI